MHFKTPTIPTLVPSLFLLVESSSYLAVSIKQKRKVNEVAKMGTFFRVEFQCIFTQRNMGVS